MAKLYLVRHGKAAAGWGKAIDPGLDETGRQQAENTAAILAAMAPVDILSSPLKRTRETSAPLSRIWGVTPRIENRVSEIPSPEKTLGERAEWIRHIMSQTWSQLDENSHIYRRKVLDALMEITSDTVIFTHFIAINVAVGNAENNDRVVVFWPDNGSVTIIDNSKGLKVIELGSEMATLVG